MKPYIHRVQYYETDMMGIVHHANYIRWMEEARIDLLDQLGFPYDVMERKGVQSPVRAVQCQYKRPCTFGDVIEIHAIVKGFNGVVMTIGYDMHRQGSAETLCSGQSEHVFLNREGRFVRMKRDMPEFCQAIEALIEGNKPV